MKGLALRWLANALALFLTANVIKGINVAGIGATLMAALVLGVVNAIIRPIIVLFTLPLNFFTLGLFTFVINGLMLMLVAKLVNGFVVDGIISAIIGAIVLSVFSGILSFLVRD